MLFFAVDKDFEIDSKRPTDLQKAFFAKDRIYGFSNLVDAQNYVSEDFAGKSYPPIYTLEISTRNPKDIGIKGAYVMGAQAISVHPETHKAHITLRNATYWDAKFLENTQVDLTEVEKSRKYKEQNIGQKKLNELINNNPIKQPTDTTGIKKTRKRREDTPPITLTLDDLKNLPPVKIPQDINQPITRNDQQPPQISTTTEQFEVTKGQPLPENLNDDLQPQTVLIPDQQKLDTVREVEKNLRISEFDIKLRNLDDVIENLKNKPEDDLKKDELPTQPAPEIPKQPDPEIPKQPAPEVPELAEPENQKSQAPEIPKPIPDDKKPSFIRKFSKYILASIIFSSISLAVAFGGGFAAISALLLKAGLIIPATKIAIFAVSVSTALLATGLVIGLYAGLRALKASYDYFKLTPEGRYNKRKSDLKAVIKPLKEELRKTEVGMNFVNEMKAYGKKIPHAKFDQNHKKIDNNNPHTRLEYNQCKLDYFRLASKRKGESLLDTTVKAKEEIQRKFNLN